MKLSNSGAVNALANKRRELVQEIEQVKGHGLGVTIVSRYQDEELVDVVRPVVLAELQRRVGVIDAELQKLGVEVDS